MRAPFPLLRAPAPVRALRSWLAPRDRILAWAPVRSGCWAASLAALWSTDGDGGRLAWEEIERVVWADPILIAHPVASGREPWQAALTRPGRLPAIVRERVEASIAVNVARRLSSGGRVRIVARRRYGAADLSFSARFERESDAADPAARAEVDAMIAEQRELFGER